MDIAHALKMALATGRVKIGLRETRDSIRSRQAKIVIVSRSCPDPVLLRESKVDGIPVYHFEGSAVELGASCGKPFPISSLAVLDAGSSNLLSLETS
jgi:large subunit ribosomal protein L30e